jgi:amino acid transporter
MFFPIAVTLNPFNLNFLAQLEYMFPGINLGLTMTIAGLILTVQVVVLLLLMVCMPRSGANYVIIARGLHPVFGLLEGWRAVLWNPITGGIVFFFVASYFGTSLVTTGRAIHNEALVSAGSAILGNPWNMVGIALIFAVIMACVDAFGSGTLKRFIIAFGLISIIVWLVMLAVFLNASPTTIPQTYDAVWGSGAYKEIIDVAVKNGWKPPPGFSWEATSASLMVATGMFYPNNIAPLGGEIAKPRTSLAIGTVGAGIVTTFMTVTLAVAMKNALGDFLSQYNFVVMKTELAAQLTINQKVTPSVPFFAASLTTNPILAFIVSFGPFLILLGATPGLYYWTSRSAFAMAFDRYFPSVFTKISRWHGPWVCTLWAFILMAAFIVLSQFYAVIFSLSVFALASLLPIFWALAGINLPYYRKHIWEKGYRKEIAGVPLEVIFGVISAALQWYILFVGLSSVSVLSNLVTVIIIMIATIAYVAYTHINMKRGIDPSKIFAEVPPE